MLILLTLARSMQYLPPKKSAEKIREDDTHLLNRLLFKINYQWAFHTLFNPNNNGMFSHNRKVCISVLVQTK